MTKKAFSGSGVTVKGKKLALQEQRKKEKRLQRKQSALKQHQSQSQKSKGPSKSSIGTQKAVDPSHAQRAKQMAQKQKKLREDAIAKRRGLLGVTNLSDLQQRVEAGNMKYQKQQQEEEGSTIAGLDVKDNSRKAYMRELKKVVGRADVVLEVLDARDPEGCRCKEIEDEILARGKRLVLVLNKIDLVPQEVIVPWLQCLRAQYPTIAFKASTQEQGSSLSQLGGKADKAIADALTGSSAVGTDALMQLLKNYCRSENIKTAITVGIVGYPNVGKSSIINSLKRQRSVGVSAQAGFTKVMQEVQLDKKIKLLDCPGIVFDDSDAGSIFLRNCINMDALSDPVPPVEVILSRCTQEQLIDLYDISPFRDVIEFLVQIAFRRGKLQKGGVADRNAAARAVLQDWNSGKIPYHTPPPKRETLHVGAEIVPQLGKNFNLEEFLNPSDLLRVIDDPAMDKMMEDADDAAAAEEAHGHQGRTRRGKTLALAPVCHHVVQEQEGGAGGKSEDEENSDSGIEEVDSDEDML